MKYEGMAAIPLSPPAISNTYANKVFSLGESSRFGAGPKQGENLCGGHEQQFCWLACLYGTLSLLSLIFACEALWSSNCDDWQAPECLREESYDEKCDVRYFRWV